MATSAGKIHEIGLRPASSRRDPFPTPIVRRSTGRAGVRRGAASSPTPISRSRKLSLATSSPRRYAAALAIALVASVAIVIAALTHAVAHMQVLP
jgi:hypothetical protein